MTTSIREVLLEGWRSIFSQGRRIILCLTAITLHRSLALCCFDPARLLRNISVYLMYLVIVGLPVVMICPLVSTCLIKALISIDPCKPSLLCLFLVFIVTLVFLLQTMTHEIGHMFGISHCQWLSCVMQGSNHLDESDRRPLDFCPICLRKLQFAIGFNIAERYKVMTHWLLKTRR